ncbi:MULTISPECIES: hypothetical protein [unclassified Flavobacterium]|uniref:hypothetical protein n=1 Tax=unclassified Flavobacterium TaxID=196869 RepID=UPI0025B984B2|nr:MULTISPECIES: hypothetical protein [unclassified Flavobacterium]
MKNNKINIELDFTFDEWKQLPFESKREIWNHYWNPYDPKIGKKTKQAIVNQFADKLNIAFEQIGIGSFGWSVYMLFVIVKESKTRIPKHFSDLSVNKEVILEYLEDKKVKVKFGYGGLTEVVLDERIIIK